MAGTYSISRSYVSNTCDPEIPGATATVTGVVTHVTGASHFSLSNADGGNFDAELRADGSFTSGLRNNVGRDGNPYELLFEGSFSATGFHAIVSVDLHRPTGTCRSVLDWQATKQGPPNTLLAPDWRH